MKKIESGEMKPIRTNWQAVQKATAPATKQKEKYTDALSNLGIEFSEEAAARPAAPAPVSVPAKSLAESARPRVATTPPAAAAAPAAAAPVSAPVTRPQQPATPTQPLRQLLRLSRRSSKGSAK